MLKFTKTLVMGTVFVATTLFASFSSTMLFAKDVEVKPDVREKTAWYDTAKWLPEGQGWHADLANHYARFPMKWKEGINKEGRAGLWGNSQSCQAGLFFRFRTNATQISVHYVLPSKPNGGNHMTGMCRHAVDLYGRADNGKWLWIGVTKIHNQEDTEHLGWTTGTMRDYILYLPLYGGVKQLEIGVPAKAEFHAVAPIEGKSILYYGTSIAQGGCASRPGLAYTSMLGRRLDIPFINLGFSGCGRMELVMADVLAEVDPLVYVLDCGPNMTNEMVKERGAAFIKRLRAKRPTTPILMVEDQGWSGSWMSSPVQKAGAKNEEFRKIYDACVAAGDKNIYYMSCLNMIGEEIDRDSTVDGQHLNDLGMYRMSQSLEKALRPILEKK
ncbi:MAG: SGNH/GDSL hydrolase family protein [Thermoguttaceae bacterium]|nr:SGNH/GDSL hydrolase family protein [Thermoguttaceae bacterium]